jgi:hypothetical protein
LKPATVSRADHEYALAKLGDAVFSAVYNLPRNLVPTSSLPVNLRNPVQYEAEALVLSLVRQAVDVLEKECSGLRIAKDPKVSREGVGPRIVKA